MAVVLSRNVVNCSPPTTSSTSYAQSQKMGKFPFTNPNPNPNPNFNNFTNSFSRKQMKSVNGGLIGGDDYKTADDLFSHYVSFDISRHTKAELKRLKLQLVSELDKVRVLSSRIESGQINSLNVNNKKRMSPFPTTNGSNKKRHEPPKQEQQQQQAAYVASAHVMKMCGTVLKKLSNQKAGVWFTSPVDAVGMGLHDYHTVIDRPMDLGTIKDRLDKGLYDTPDDFATDVRLTFNNALRYNPKGHEVNTFAGQYLALFERWFPPILAKFEAEKRLHLAQIGPKLVEDDVQGSSWSKFPSPEVVKTPKVKEFKPPTPPPRSPSPPVVVVAVEPEVVAAAAPVVVERSGGERRGRKSEGKLPKPKAKDPNKREMSMEEKHKLGAGLQELPEEKMVQVIQIIRKRNGNLTQEGDEIELDIEAVDTETLWELDRLVTNYKKMVSKIKRQALMPQCNNVGEFDDNNQVGMSDMMMVDMSTKAKKGGGGGGGDVGEEDVDIGDEMPVNNFPPLEIDKDDDKQQGGGSSSSGTSSSSGSDDSSSSDSDSRSSSGSDSDIDDAQSRDNESKNFQH